MLRAQRPTQDATCCALAVADTRPLALLNSDRKVAAAVVSDVCAEVCTAGLHSIQNGFVRGRNFLDNVVDLDGHARIASQAAVANASAFAARPGLAAWD